MAKTPALTKRDELDVHYENPHPIYRRQTTTQSAQSAQPHIRKVIETPKVVMQRRDGYEIHRRKRINIVFADEMPQGPEPTNDNKNTDAEPAVEPTEDLPNNNEFRKVSKLAVPSTQDAKVLTATTLSNDVDGLGGVLVLNGDGHSGGSSEGIENSLGLSNLLGAGVGTKLLGGASKSTTLHYDRRALLDNMNTRDSDVKTDDVLGFGTKLDALNTHFRSVNGKPMSKEAIDQMMADTAKNSMNSKPMAGEEESTQTQTTSLLSLDNGVGLLGDTIHSSKYNGDTSTGIDNLANLAGGTDVLSQSVTQTKHNDGSVTRKAGSRIANTNLLANVLGDATHNIDTADNKQRYVDDVAAVGTGASVLPAMDSVTVLKDGTVIRESDRNVAQVDVLSNVAGKASQSVIRQRRGLLSGFNIFEDNRATTQAMPVEKPTFNGPRPLSGTTTATDVQTINGANVNTDFNLIGSSGVISNNGIDNAVANTNDVGLAGGISALGGTTKATTTTMPLQRRATGSDAKVLTATTLSNDVDGLGGVLVLNGDGHSGGSSEGIENSLGLSNLLGAGVGTKLLGGASKSTTLHYDRRALLDNMNTRDSDVKTDDVLGFGLLGDTIHSSKYNGDTSTGIDNLANLAGGTDVLSQSVTQTKHNDGSVTRKAGSRIANTNLLANVLGDATHNIDTADNKQRYVDDVAAVGTGASVLPAMDSVTVLKDGTVIRESDRNVAQVDVLSNVAGKASQSVIRQRRDNRATTQAMPVEKPTFNGPRPLSGTTTATDVQTINGANVNTDFNLIGSSGVISNNGIDNAVANTNDVGLAGGISALGGTTKATTTTMPLQ
ncbi:hypothetical protein BDF19DRAFT_496761 [Syncephalis fuscata]|nr:hypothetical protein BDF19DRAFT_496761 [Syncephalis fuscata]